MKRVLLLTVLVCLFSLSGCSECDDVCQKNEIEELKIRNEHEQYMFDHRTKPDICRKNCQSMLFDDNVLSCFESCMEDS